MSRTTFSRKSIPAWTLLFVFVLINVFSAVWVKRDVEQKEIRRFGFAADQVSIKVRERLESYELILRSGAGLFVASDTVSRAEWKRFVTEVDAAHIVPGFQGIGYASVVRPNDLDRRVAAIRAEGYHDFAVWPAGQRTIYTSVIYLEPFTGANLRAFGYDMFSEPTRRAAMESARDTGNATLSGRVRLVQETTDQPQSGTLMYVAVYQHGMATDTVEQRRAALVGWVYSSFRMNDLMSGILHDWMGTEGRYIGLTIYDGTQATPDTVMFDSSGGTVGRRQTIVSTARAVQLHDRQWLLAFDAIPGSPGVDYGPAWAALLIGLALSLLVFRLILQRITTTQEAERIAAGLTADICRHQQSLAESEERWKFAVEGNGDGLWDWDITSGVMFFSPRWKSMLGHTEEDIGTTLDEWSSRVHPADLPAALDAVKACQDGIAPAYVSEHRMRCKDGSDKWILDRGIVVSRDADGTPLRMIGTNRDITDRRGTEARIARLTNLYRALSECNAAIVRCATQEELFDRICEVAVEHGGVAMAWIGLLDDATCRVVPGASHGNGTEYLEGIHISTRADDPHGMGPTGTAIRENRPVWLDDYLHDERMSPWVARGAANGWAASAALPLFSAGRAVGALTFYSTSSGWFDEETRQLLEEMARDISFAIDKFRAEQESESYQVTLVEAEQRFRSLIGQSMTGAYILQDGTIAYTNPRLKQILGYEESDDLTGLDPTKIFSSSELPLAQERMEALLAGAVQLTDATFTARRKDGTTVDVGTSSSLATYQGRPAVIGLLQDISNQKVAEAQIRRYAKLLEHTFIQTVGLATTISEMRDPYTAGHEQRVAEIAVAIGEELALPRDRLEGLKVGGYLHDVGKMSVPAEILVKPSRLTKLEMSLVRQHAQAGYDVLKGVDFPWPVAQIALQHHERVDGSGYPNGLKGDEILLEARIVAVADVVESMSTHRPYRAAMGLEAALAEIEQGAGTDYDTEVVAACLRVFANHPGLADLTEPTRLVSAAPSH